MMREFKNIGGGRKIRWGLEDKGSNEGRESRGRVGGRVGEEGEDGGMEKWRGGEGRG